MPRPQLIALLLPTYQLSWGTGYECPGMYLVFMALYTSLYAVSSDTFLILTYSHPHTTCCLLILIHSSLSTCHIIDDCMYVLCVYYLPYISNIIMHKFLPLPTFPTSLLRLCHAKSKSQRQKKKKKKKERKTKKERK